MGIPPGMPERWKSVWMPTSGTIELEKLVKSGKGLGGDGTITCTLAFAVKLAEVAVITTSPVWPTTGVTRPVALTFAMAGKLDVHVVMGSIKNIGEKLGVNCWVELYARMIGDGLDDGSNVMVGVVGHVPKKDRLFITTFEVAKLTT